MSVADVMRTVRPDTPLPATSVTDPLTLVEVQLFAPPDWAPTYSALESGVGLELDGVEVEVTSGALVAEGATVTFGGRMVISGDGTTGAGKGVDVRTTMGDGTENGVALGVGVGSAVDVVVAGGGGGSVGRSNGPEGA